MPASVFTLVSALPFGNLSSKLRGALLPSLSLRSCRLGPVERGRGGACVAPAGC
jgi:hypothetical protein